jgi:nitrogen fixation protein FixH
MMVSSQPSGPRRGLTGTHVLMSLVGFFAVIVVADATLIYKALTTFGGVDNVKAYRDGLAYNQRIESDTRQSALGWEEGVELGGDPLRLRVSLKDREGAPVAGKKLVAEVGRPATNRFDSKLNLVEVNPGIYEAMLETAGQGTWIADVQAFSSHDAAKPDFQVRRRLWVAP